MANILAGMPAGSSGMILTMNQFWWAVNPMIVPMKFSVMSAIGLTDSTEC